MNRDEFKALTTERLVKKLAARWEPPDRLRGNETEQRAQLADLRDAVIQRLPNIDAENVGLILDRSWQALFSAHRYRTWPDAPAVLAVVSDEAALVESRLPRNERPKHRPEPASPEDIAARMEAKFGWAVRWHIASGGSRVSAVKQDAAGKIIAIRRGPTGPWEPPAVEGVVG